MSNTEIIKEFLELWQKQFLEFSRDNAPFVKILQENYIKSINKDGNVFTNTNSDLNANDEIIELRKRIAELEGRLNVLESAFARRGAETV